MSTTRVVREEVTAHGPVHRRGPWTMGDRVVAELTVLALVWGLVAVALAVIGWFHWWLVVPLALGAFFLARRGIPRSERRLDFWWWAAIVVAAATLFINGLHPGEHLLTGRDSGTYLATAAWLAEDSSLLVDVRSGPLGEVEEVEFTVPGFYDRTGRPELEPQFMHTFPAMLATLIDIGGLEASHWLNPVLGALLLLAVFSLARRFARPWAALLAVLALATSLVFLYYARTPFTEVLMALFAISGLGLMGVAEERSDPRLASLAGAALGATVLARVDGVVLLIPLTLYLLVKARSDRSQEQMYRRVRHVMYAVALLGLVESLFVAPAYILDRSAQVGSPLLVVLLLLVGNDLFGDRIEGLWAEKVLPNRDTVFLVVLAIAALLLAYAWVIRPHLARPMQSADLSSIQVSEGLDVEPRSYAELSVRWVAWYQGPAFVLLGFVGAAVSTRRAIRGRSSPPTWLLPLVLATFSALYFWRPSITPDHIWAMRRFLTVIIPLGAVAAAVAVDSLCEGARRWVGRTWMRSAVAVALGAALLVPSLAVAAPVWDVSEIEGLTEDMGELCSELGPDATVLIVDLTLAQFLAQSFRSYCGLDAGWIPAGSVAKIEEIRSVVEGAGSSLAVVTLDGAGDVFLDGDYRRLELTLSRPPSSTSPYPIGISVDH